MLPEHQEGSCQLLKHAKGIQIILVILGIPDSHINSSILSDEVVPTSW